MFQGSVGKVGTITVFSSAPPVPSTEFELTPRHEQEDGEHEKIPVCTNPCGSDYAPEHKGVLSIPVISGKKIILYNSNFITNYSKNCNTYSNFEIKCVI